MKSPEPKIQFICVNPGINNSQNSYKKINIFTDELKDEYLKNKILENKGIFRSIHLKLTYC